MPQEIDLKQIERKAYLSCYQDGIWDLFIGLAFIGMAVGVIYNNTAITAIMPAIGIIIVPGLKKSITLLIFSIILLGFVSAILTYLNKTRISYPKIRKLPPLTNLGIMLYIQ